MTHLTPSEVQFRDWLSGGSVGAKAWTGDDDSIRALDRLGIDPDMPFEQFRRRLAMGERAERADYERAEDTVGDLVHFADGWDACLHLIRAGL